MRIIPIYASTALTVIAASSAQASSAQGTVFTATSATLQTVMTKATGGDTVKLVGSFGLTKLTNKNFTSLVTIDASAASFTDSLILTNISNINVVGGHFGSDSAMTSWGRAVAIVGGANVSFTNPYVTGYYAGAGIAFSGTSNATVTGANLSKLAAGVVFTNVTGGAISNSNSIASVGDGFDIADSSKIDIGNNRCTGSTPVVGAHPDCVQLMNSAGAVPLTQINIHNNYASGETQGFNNFASSPGDSYISIVNNRIDGLLPQGIACYYCVNSTITGNTLTTSDGAPYQVSLNVLYGSNNTVSGNSVGALNRSATRALITYTRDQLIGHAVVVAATPAGWVPEPAAWTMLIAGFGMVGVGQRTRRRYSPA